MTDELTVYERQMTLRSVIVGLVILVCVGGATLPERADIVCGLALGFVFSLLRFRLQVKNLIRFGLYAKQSKKKATGYLMSRSMMNLMTAAAALLIAGMHQEVLNMVATAAGLFLTNGVIVGRELIRGVVGRTRS